MIFYLLEGMETIALMPEVDAFEGDANSTTIYRGENLHPDFKEKAKIFDASGFEEHCFNTPCFFQGNHPLSTSFSGSCKSSFVINGKKVVQKIKVKLRIFRYLHQGNVARFASHWRKPTEASRRSN